jgi:hypothetical protein
MMSEADEKQGTSERQVNEVLLEAQQAIQALQQQALWKPGKDVEHLERRKRYGHVGEDFSLDQYNELIHALASHPKSDVYLYTFPPSQERYYVTAGEIKKERWIVMVGKTGVIETAFPPTDFETYTRERDWVSLGKLPEVLSHE